MDIYLTYTTGKTKAELIQQTAQKYQGTQLAVITGKNNLENPALKAKNIPAIIWDKTKMSLAELLNQQDTTFSEIPIAKF